MEGVDGDFLHFFFLWFSPRRSNCFCLLFFSLPCLTRSFAKEAKLPMETPKVREAHVFFLSISSHRNSSKNALKIFFETKLQYNMHCILARGFEANVAQAQHLRAGPPLSVRVSSGPTRTFSFFHLIRSQQGELELNQSDF